MEELFDLLEAVREAEASAAASSDAYLKSLIAQEHEEAKAESHSRSVLTVARQHPFIPAAQRASTATRSLRVILKSITFQVDTIH